MLFVSRLLMIGPRHLFVCNSCVHTRKRLFQNILGNKLTRGTNHTFKLILYRNLTSETGKARQWNSVYYILGTICLAASVTYASVPLYRMFCQAQGLGGRAESDKKYEQIATMEKINQKLIKVKFNADTQAQLRWKFEPQQDEIWVHPGETALAFYRATNPTKEPIVGISTYNVIPFEAGLYFAKIQCFCFEEQLLNPGETVDMPVFFYIDPSIIDDPRLFLTDEIVLSYTFFESRQGLVLPKPLTPEDRQ